MSRDNEALMDNARIAIVLLGLAAHAFIGGSAVLVLANWAMNAAG